MKLTEKEKFAIACALRLARGRYEDDAASAREAAVRAKGAKPAEGWTRIAEQFDKQVRECDALLDDKFENCL